MQQIPFVHLQCHSEYSISDGICRVNDLIEAAKQYNMPAVALTDVNNLFAMIKFYRAAIVAGVKPIVGCEVYVAPFADKEVCRVLLLCQNLSGYKQLTELLSRAYLNKPQTNKVVVEYSWVLALTDIIVIAVAQHSDLALSLHTQDITETKALLSCWHTLGNNFYIGLCRTNRAGEDDFIAKIVPLSIEFNIPLVAINEVCFMRQQDFEAHEARLCIHQGCQLTDEREETHAELQYFAAADKMQQRFADLPEALINSVEIAKRCNLQLELGKVFLPTYAPPSNYSAEQYLVVQAQQGLQQRFTEVTPKYSERLAVELSVINDMGFASYFLIVADFIAWAKQQNIPVGPGRGSGAGSLVAYSLGITNIDPLPYDLLFERFLNPDRVSMPDFDIDFCMEGRDKVIEYVANRYGKLAVSQIVTFGTMAAKAVIRDVGRVLGHGYGFVDKIAKLIPLELGITLDKALQQEELLKQRYKEEEEVKVLIDLARKLEGITRNVGKHAGGVVIAPGKITDFSPIYCEDDAAQIITQFDKNDIENIGLVKFDFLGLRTLTIIKWALVNIKTRQAKIIDIDLIDLADKETFALLCAQKTVAIFQLESRGMQDLIGRLRPDCFEDIVALVALFRPGPLQSGMVDDFIQRKLGQAKIKYLHPALETILKPTYGVIVYQEQVMQIAQELAGYTLAAADLLRRAMGKKKPEEMARQRELFVDGAISKGVNEYIADHIFALMEKFAGYGFNKSHSVAYAMISYQTAWLKAHYPAEFMAAVLSADMANTDKIIELVDDCHNMQLVILPPNINSSHYYFSVTNNGEILYGLGAIKGIGKSIIESLAECRQDKKFASLFDLAVSLGERRVSKKILEVLIFSGACDVFGVSRDRLHAQIPLALQAASQIHKSAQLGQGDLFGHKLDLSFAEPQDIVAWGKAEILSKEKSSLGLYLSGHPLDEYKLELQHIVDCELKNLADKKQACIAGILLNMRTMLTKRGDKLAILTLADSATKIEVTVFADMLLQYKDILTKESLLVIDVHMQTDRFTQGYKARAQKIYTLCEFRNAYVKKLKFTLMQQHTDLPWLAKLKTIINKFPGNKPIEFEYCNTQGKVILTRSERSGIDICPELLEMLNDFNSRLQITWCY